MHLLEISKAVVDDLWNESLKKNRALTGFEPMNMIAHLVEHCTGVAEVMGSNPEFFDHL